MGGLILLRFSSPLFFVASIIVPDFFSPRLFRSHLSLTTWNDRRKSRSFVRFVRVAGGPKERLQEKDRGGSDGAEAEQGEELLQNARGGAQRPAEGDQEGVPGARAEMAPGQEHRRHRGSRREDVPGHIGGVRGIVGQGATGEVRSGRGGVREPGRGRRRRRTAEASHGSEHVLPAEFRRTTAGASGRWRATIPLPIRWIERRMLFCLRLEIPNNLSANGIRSIIK